MINLIKINDFHGREIELELFPLTIFTGNNGLGKTKILMDIHYKLVKKTTEKEPWDFHFYNISIKNLEEWNKKMHEFYNTTDIILLTNPGIWLDQKNQTLMGEKIAELVSEGKQIFVETHSDYIFQGIRLAVKDKIIKSQDIIFYHLYKDDSDSVQIETIKLDKTGQCIAKHSSFFGQMSSNLCRLI